MSYFYSVRGWLELSWPDAEFEGVDETPEQHADKVRRVREFTTCALSPEQLEDESADADERIKAGWGWPQNNLDGTEYVFYGADVEEPSMVMEQIKQILAMDPFADGYFSIEGEDGEQYRQWVIKSGKVYTRHHLFPDFDGEGAPEGYTLFFRSASS